MHEYSYALIMASFIIVPGIGVVARAPGTLDAVSSTETSLREIADLRKQAGLRQPAWLEEGGEEL